MVVIRLSRCGAKKRPFYRIVATDSRNKRDGRYLQQIGYYDPLDKKGENAISINLEYLNEWLGNGAQMSDRVLYLVKKFKKGAEAPVATENPVKKAAPVAKKAAVAKETKPKAAVAKEAKPKAVVAKETKPKAESAAKPSAVKATKPTVKKEASK
jgi:small subunit ribosomal protein S16